MIGARWVKDQFWLIPASLCLAAVVLAQTLVLVGRSVDMPALWLGELGPSSAGDLMGVLAGSLLTATATTFSITIAVIVLTSSAFGARLVRNFMDDRGSQVVLGMFLGSFLYAVIVLRSITADSVPALAVNVALILTLVDVGLLVYYIHHITDSVQLATLSRRLGAEFEQVIQAVYPEDTSHDEPRVAVPAGRSQPVLAPRHGYLADRDIKRLTDLATDHSCSVRLLVRVGDHIIEGDQIAEILWSTGPEGEGADPACDDLLSCLSITSARTPVQDVSLAAEQLRELLVRALSPGINDPQTAENAMDELTVGLVNLAQRPVHPERRIGGENPDSVVILPEVTLPQLLEALFSDLRIHATQSPAVLRQALRLSEQIAGRSSDAEVISQLLEQVDGLETAVRGGQLNAVDLNEFERACASTRSRLAHLRTVDEEPAPRES